MNGQGLEVRGDHTFADEALDVEVFVLDAEHLSLAGLATVLAGDGPPSPSSLLLLLQRAGDSRLVEY